MGSARRRAMLVAASAFLVGAVGGGGCEAPRRRSSAAEKGLSENTADCATLKWSFSAHSVSTTAHCSSREGSRLYPPAAGQLAGSCSSDETYQAALHRCETAGARLCTKIELLDFANRGLGCGTDASLMWTSSSAGCAPGQHWQVYGNGDPASPVCVADTDTSQAVACCSDNSVEGSTPPVFDNVVRLADVEGADPTGQGSSTAAFRAARQLLIDRSGGGAQSAWGAIDLGSGRWRFDGSETVDGKTTKLWVPQGMGLFGDGSWNGDSADLDDTYHRAACSISFEGVPTDSAISLQHYGGGNAYYPSWLKGFHIKDNTTSHQGIKAGIYLAGRYGVIVENVSISHFLRGDWTAPEPDGPAGAVTESSGAWAINVEPSSDGGQSDWGHFSDIFIVDTTHGIRVSYRAAPDLSFENVRMRSGHHRRSGDHTPLSGSIGWMIRSPAIVVTGPNTTSFFDRGFVLEGTDAGVGSSGGHFTLKGELHIEAHELSADGTHASGLEVRQGTAAQSNGMIPMLDLVELGNADKMTNPVIVDSVEDIRLYGRVRGGQALRPDSTQWIDYRQTVRHVTGKIGDVPIAVPNP